MAVTDLPILGSELQVVRKNTFLEVIPVVKSSWEGRRAHTEPSWSRETTPERAFIQEGSAAGSRLSTPTLRNRDLQESQQSWGLYGGQWSYDGQWYGNEGGMYDPHTQQWMPNQYEGYGYDEQYAMNEDGEEWGVERRDMWGKGGKRKQRRPQGSKVFVGGLSARTTDEALRTAFAKFGTVAHAAVLVDAQQRSRGFGYVTFAGDVPDGVVDFDHLIDGRMCGARLYNYSARRGA